MYSRRAYILLDSYITWIAVGRQYEAILRCIYFFIYFFPVLGILTRKAGKVGGK